MDDYYPKDSSEDEGSVLGNDDIGLRRLDNPTRPEQPSNQSETALHDCSSPVLDPKHILPGSQATEETYRAGLVASAVESETVDTSSSMQIPTPSDTGSACTNRPKVIENLQGTKTLPQKPNNALASLSTKYAGAKERAAAMSKTSARDNLSKAKQGGQATENVFAGGKQQKQRKNLQDASNDSSKDPKFLTHRYTRLLEVGSRDKENSAPAQMPRNLISLDPKVPRAIVTTRAVTSPQERPPQQGDAGKAMEDTARPTIALRKGPPERTPSADSVKDANATQPQLRRKKSVRWDDNVQTNSHEKAEGNGPEPSLFVPDEGRVRSPRTIHENDTPPRHNFQACRPEKECQVNGAPRESTQNITKPCFLGSQASRPLNLVFEDVPQGGLHPWIADFRAQDRLVFSHTCAAQDYEQQFRSPNQCKNLACGYISAPTDQVTLEMVADRLKLGSQGILCHSAHYCVLVFPSKSEEWEFEATRFPLANGSLMYIVFEPINFAKEDLTTVKSSTTADGGSWEKSLPKSLGHFTHLDYQKVFPLTLHSSEKHYFFLAFPPSSGEEARLLASWLNASSKAECVIYDSHSPGDWLQFINVGKGAMIIHEDVIWKMRLFPRMFEVLNQASCGNFALSIFRRACGGQISMSPPSTGDPVIGDIGLQRPSLSQKVFLMTPSFIVSQPQQARHFVNYFLKTHDPVEGAFNPPKLAVPTNFEAWLEDLLLERSNMPAERDTDIHSEDMKALAKLVYRVGNLTESSSGDDTLSPLIFAPAGIDASDEQSLVNWFGWWTIANLDPYGRFYVLGSTHNTHGMTRAIKPLRYLRGTVNDPDKVLESLGQRVTSHSASENKGANVDDAASTESAEKTTKFALVQDDDPLTLKKHLQGVYGDFMRTHSPVWLNFLPVAYWDQDMPYHFNDIRGIFASFSQWFDSLLPFHEVGAKGRPMKNTLAGFFYTPDLDWASTEPGDAKTARHPWLAFLRPINPHMKWMESELLIWDPRYLGKFRPGEEAYVDDLDEVHQKFIRLVGDKNAVKNPSMPLNKVWIGGWEPLHVPYTNRLDVTLSFLEKAGNETKVWLPAPAPQMEGRGWKLINPGARQHGRSMDVDMGEEKAGHTGAEERRGYGWNEPQDAKILFLPPRGRQNKGKGRSSLCKNFLYVQSLNATHKGNDERMVFTYLPTNQWYGQQIAEGRDFKHIMVDTWKNVFQQLRISVPE